jgi:hypothetical protein
MKLFLCTALLIFPSLCFSIELLDECGSTFEESIRDLEVRCFNLYEEDKILVSKFINENATIIETYSDSEDDFLEHWELVE